MNYGGPPPPQQGFSVEDLIKALKRLKKLEGNKEKKEKKEDEKSFKMVPVPIKKPSTFTTVQMMFILTALFPVVGPIYYLSVIGSWSLLKAGMMTLLGN